MLSGIRECCPWSKLQKVSPCWTASNPHPPGLRHVVNPGRNCSSTQGQTAILSIPAEGKISTTVCNQHTPTSLHHRPHSTLKMCCDRSAIWFSYFSKHCRHFLKMHQRWPQDPVFGWALIIYHQPGFHLQACCTCAVIYTYRWPSYCRQKWQCRLKLILTVFGVYLHPEKSCSHPFAPSLLSPRDTRAFLS